MAEGLDREWFFGRLQSRKQSLRGLARFMGLDPSAVSRIVSGERGLKANEQDAIATFLGVSIDEIAAHRMGVTEEEGFAEMKQADFEPQLPVAADKPGNKTPYRHPAWGAMKGMITLLPDVDLTAPAYGDWKKLYGEDK